MNKIENIERKRYIKLLMKDEKIRNLIIGLAKQLNQEIIADLKVLAERYQIPYSKAWRVVNFLRTAGVLTLKAEPNYPALGLTPILYIIDIDTENWLEHANKLLYLKYAVEAYGKGRRALLLITAPSDIMKEHIEYIESNIGKIVEYYVFDHAVIGVPNLNYLTVDKVPWHEIPVVFYDKVRSKRKFDKLDISIIASLERDAPKKVSEISEELKVNRKTIEYRMKSRVAPLIEGFQLRLSLWPFDIAPRLAVVVKGSEAHRLITIMSSSYPSAVYLGRNIAFGIIQLPCKERVNFARYLSTIGEWEEYILELNEIRRTLPVEAVVEPGNWVEKVSKE
ncbi:MAG: hypothetical protein DRJ37_00360 [Thermoprotei archaeon]|nr:MAG: hypothetical protein DRJ37_00360 [Thermoprotei archaeon]